MFLLIPWIPAWTLQSTKVRTIIISLLCSLCLGTRSPTLYTDTTTLIVPLSVHKINSAYSFTLQGVQTSLSCSSFSLDIMVLCTVLIKYIERKQHTKRVIWFFYACRHCYNMIGAVLVTRLAQTYGIFWCQWLHYILRYGIQRLCVALYLHSHRWFEM